MNFNQYPIKIQVDGIDPDVYCPEIWNRLYINQLNDQFDYKPCCYYQSPRESKKLLDNFSNIYDDYNQSDFVTNLRTKNKNSIPDAGCNHCYNLDKVNPDASGRAHALKSEQNRLLGNKVEVTTHIDLNLGNLCNLSCAICGPYNSSNWVPIYDKGWSIAPDELRYKKKNRQVIDDPALFLSLKTVQLQGGEIFMEPGYYEFFKNLGKYKTYDDLSVWIFTNGTTLPSPEFMDILNSMSKVRIFFSVDDIEQRFEYQRRGADWDAVVKNIDWFRDHAGPNFELNFNITYSLYNVYYLKELQECLSVRFPNIARRFTPFNSGLANCSANIVTGKVRDAVLSKTQGITELDFLNSYMVQDDAVSYKEFLDYVAKYDGLTATSYAESHMEFYNLLVNT